MCCVDQSFAQDLQRGRARERVDAICYSGIGAHKDEHGFQNGFLDRKGVSCAFFELFGKDDSGLMRCEFVPVHGL